MSMVGESGYGADLGLCEQIAQRKFALRPASMQHATRDFFFLSGETMLLSAP
jgi:hypothetical protein